MRPRSCSMWKVGDAVIVGMAGGGGMAEEIVVSSMMCIPKPPAFTHVQAAAFPVGFLTAYHVSKRCTAALQQL